SSSSSSSSRIDLVGVIAPSDLIFPERAIAGAPLTVSLAGAVQGSGQRQSGLSFNGVPVNQDEDGKAIYNVPEDATPGKSLKVTRPGEPEGLLGVVEVLQPLAASDQQEPPHIDSVTNPVHPGGMLVVSGHNFQGVWHENAVLIDGKKSTVLKACSPVQIKVLIPNDIEAGKHTITVNCRDCLSNEASFEAIAVEAKMEPRALRGRQISGKHPKKGQFESMLGLPRVD
ncbi:MAG: hypothetical protein C5B53_12940, partial [Candidatus Melainabacteria bacterium]